MGAGEVLPPEATQILSGLSAAHQALMQAAITGNGVIRRNDNGLFESVASISERF